MTRQRDRHSAASIRARLLERAKDEREEFQRVLVRYANERVLYRLSKSRYRDVFVLKGASLFALWHGSTPRATKDVDLLGTGPADPERLSRIFVEVLSTIVEPDGLSFDDSSVKAEAIREEAIYDGIRVTFQAQLGTAQLAIQADVGFGDAVDPPAETIRYPTLLDMPAPSLRAYRRELVIAEKFHAMALLGLANSRMKDYFDIAFLASHFTFEGADLVRALHATFERRETPLARELPMALTDEFTQDPQKQAQWAAFLRRVREDARRDLAESVATIRALLEPAVRAASEASLFHATWTDGRWR